ncbi:MAG: hypothetical protein HXS44_04875, partial [Theionarchaea archaeon]|nr:hypothetical protein [Theionarchaea archaeon]
MIQKQDSTYLMCYTDKVSTSYYIRQKTSPDGVTWSAPSNVILVDNQTGNPALLQRDSGVLYLTYRKGSSIHVISNSGSGWSSPVQTTTTAQGDPALLDTGTDILIIYKGTDGYFYRISSPDGQTWSSPSQMAPQKPLSSPSAMRRKDRLYRVVSQSISSSAVDLVKVVEFSYEGDSNLTWSSDVLIRDAQTLQSSMHFEYDSKGRPIERISKDSQGVQTQKAVYTYSGNDQVIREDIYSGTSPEISYSTITGFDDHGNITYSREPEGSEHFYSYANTNSQNQFTDSKGVPVVLFTNQFYINSIPSDCHTLLVGQAFINNGKVAETYYKYDISGNHIETKTLSPTRDYAAFSGVFDETGQNTFEFDLTGLTITDGIIVISSIAVPTSETLYETHSEPGKGYQNTGIWQGNYFMADYFRCVTTVPPDCFTGQTKVGPFEHYPGSPDYTGYTLWVEDNFQYVKTSYTQIVNEYPMEVNYKINTSSWNTITDNLGPGTTSTIIPASYFVDGSNTLQFGETNAYNTICEWSLYINQGSTPESFVTQFAYDSYGNMTSFTDARGNTTSMSYDSQYHAYVVSILNALNETISASYDFSTGKVTSMTDAKGYTTSFQYDIMGRVRKRINPDQTEKEAVYNDQDNYIIIHDELDNKTIYYYDGINRVTRTEWYLTDTTFLAETYTYTYMGALKAKTDPNGHVYAYEYDSQGRILECINPDFTTKQIQYDDITNMVTTLDENQHKKAYHYDWKGRLLQVREYTDPVNFYLTEYTYDLLGNMTSFTDAKGNTTSYEYNSLFGASRIVYPDSTVETFEYDSCGNVIGKVNGYGVTTFGYDTLSRLISISYPDHTVTFAYDMNGNRTLMTDPEGQTSSVYDNRNRLLSETRTINGESYTVTHAYDAASQTTSLVYPDQNFVFYEYDSLGRMMNVSGYGEFTYNGESLSTVTFGNGVVTHYQYDNRHRPVNIQAKKDGTDILEMNYSYDFTGNLLQLGYDRMQGGQWVESVETYEFDWLDRLLSVDSLQGRITYTYDPVGNRLSQNDVNYTYNVMNELLSGDGKIFTY